MAFWQKTIITAVLAAACNVARTQGIHIPPGTEEVLYSLALVFLRLGMGKAEKAAKEVGATSPPIGVEKQREGK